VTKVAQPKGSKICDESCKIFHLDTMVLDGNAFGASDKVSVEVFQRRPKTYTVVLASIDLSAVAIFCKVVLLVAHDHKLKFA